MALIPITFNADDTNNAKKGKVRGQDLASFLSVSMPKRAGILDIFENPCEKYGNTIISGDVATFTLHAGYINIYGRCIYIEEGTQVAITLPENGTVSGYFGVRINLGESASNECSFFTKTGELVTNNILDNISTGIYEFRLYNYTASPNSLELSNKTTEIIENLDDYLKGANFDTPAVDDISGKLATTEFVENYINNYLKHNYQIWEGQVASGSKTLRHIFAQTDLFESRTIDGSVAAIEAGEITKIRWGEDKYRSTSKEDMVVITSYTGQDRSGGYTSMDYPLRVTEVFKDGFNVSNPNDVTVTLTYVVFGRSPIANP